MLGYTDPGSHKDEVREIPLRNVPLSKLSHYRFIQRRSGSKSRNQLSGQPAKPAKDLEVLRRIAKYYVDHPPTTSSVGAFKDRVSSIDKVLGPIRRRQTNAISSYYVSDFIVETARKLKDIVPQDKDFAKSARKVWRTPIDSFMTKRHIDLLDDIISKHVIRQPDLNTKPLATLHR